MMYPLVRELAVGGIPVAVTCRVLKIARQPYCRWLAQPITAAELTAAYRANALFDAHRDDPEFGYRFLVDEAREVGQPMAEGTAWKICSQGGWWSAFGKKRGRNGKKAGPPVHDDLVERDFTAAAANRLWLADITEHWTREGKLYLCAVKDVYSNRIVGYAIDSRMKSRIAVAAPDNAVARRRAEEAMSPAACCTPTAGRSSGPGSSSTDSTASDGRLDGPRRRRRRQRSHGVLLFPAPEERPQPPLMNHPRGAPDRHRDLDRVHVSRTPPAGCARTIDPRRIRVDHDDNRRAGGITRTVTRSCSRPVRSSYGDRQRDARALRTEQFEVKVLECRRVAPDASSSSRRAN
jgi:transposase InsO family protein